MASPTPFDLNTTVQDGLAIVAGAGGLDCATAPRLSQAHARLAEPGRVVLVDLSGTELIDCASATVRRQQLESSRRVAGGRS